MYMVNVCILSSYVCVACLSLSLSLSLYIYIYIYIFCLNPGVDTYGSIYVVKV